MESEKMEFIEGLCSRPHKGNELRAGPARQNHGRAESSEVDWRTVKTAQASVRGNAISSERGRFLRSDPGEGDEENLEMWSTDPFRFTAAEAGACRPLADR